MTLFIIHGDLESKFIQKARPPKSGKLKLVILLLTSCVKFKAKRCLKDTVSTPLMGEIRKDLFHQKWCGVFLQKQKCILSSGGLLKV